MRLRPVQLIPVKPYIIKKSIRSWVKVTALSWSVHYQHDQVRTFASAWNFSSPCWANQSYK